MQGKVKLHHILATFFFNCIVEKSAVDKWNDAIFSVNRFILFGGEHGEVPVLFQK